MTWAAALACVVRYSSFAMRSDTFRRAFQGQLLAFFAAHQRDLPWRRNRDPYPIWISEIMLQQTRVAAVIPYFERWMERFPTVGDLAAAELDDVLAAWSGLGYYSRARNLHRGAKDVVERYGGELPKTAAELERLPGVGRYTAGAIASQAYGERAALVDGNVARVFARVFGIEDDIKSTKGQAELWKLAAELVPDQSPGDFNQGLMELGATVCTPKSPSCQSCPVSDHCFARRTGRQAELPVVRARKKAGDKPLLRHDAVWLWREGEVLLARRRPEGLFGGLWELPQALDLSALSDAMGAPIELDARRPLHVHEQELSHRRLQIRVFRARPHDHSSELPEGSCYDAVDWQSLTSARKCGLSSATQQIIDIAEKDSKWTTATKPRSSSKRATKSS